MHLDTKNYLKSNRYHTVKHPPNKESVVFTLSFVSYTYIIYAN
jgi:hypothetical protein